MHLSICSYAALTPRPTVGENPGLVMAQGQPSLNFLTEECSEKDKGGLFNVHRRALPTAPFFFFYSLLFASCVSNLVRSLAYGIPDFFFGV